VSFTTPDDAISHWTAVLTANQALAQRLGCRIGLTLKGSAGRSWEIDCRKEIKVRQLKDGNLEQCDVALSLEPDVFLALVNGELNPQVAFLMGKIALSGDTSVALKMHELFNAVRDR